MEDHDVPPLGSPLVVTEFFDQEPVLNLQPGQHGSRGDVAGLHQKLANTEGHRQGDHHAAPKSPGAFLPRQLPLALRVLPFLTVLPLWTILAVFRGIS